MAFTTIHNSAMINEEFNIPLDGLDDLETLLPPDPPAVRPALKEYSQNFIMELALGLESPDSLCIRYDITPHEFDLLQANTVFQTDLKNWQAKMLDEGLSFKLKARVQAESYLQDIDQIITSTDVSYETKLSAITRVVEWAGLSGKNAQEQGSSKPSVVINITRFSDDDKKTIEIN